MSKLSRGICCALVVAFALPMLLSVTAPRASANPGTWDDWPYYREITIDPLNPENYQIMVFLDNLTHMNADLSDIRFSEDLHTEALPYWIKNYTVDNARVWVRRLGNSDDKIFLHYGNASAGSAENGDATFVFFDDFSGDLGKWALTGSERIQIVAGEARLQGNDGWSTTGMVSNTTFSRPIILEWKSRVSNTGQATIEGYQEGTTLSPSTYVTWERAGNEQYRRKTNIGWSDSYGYVDLTQIDMKIEIPPTQGYKMYWARELKETDTTWTTVADRLVFKPYNANYEYVDDVRVRKYVSPEPTASVGSEESYGAPPPSDVDIISVSVDNSLIDNRVDFVGSGAITSTRLSIIIGDNMGRDCLTLDNVRMWVRDGSDAVWVDNVAATSYSNVGDNENRKIFYLILDTTDNDLNLGQFDVRVIAHDNYGTSDAKGYTGIGTNVFIVSDLSITRSVENIPGHEIRAYGVVSRDYGSISLDYCRIIDNTHGELTPTFLENGSYEHTYAPTVDGKFYVRVVDDVLDGVSENLDYLFPNFTPEIVSITSSEPLVDRDLDHAGSGATLTTTLTVRIKDQDGRLDLNAARIAVRDKNDAVQENEDVWASKTIVDENQYDVTLTYNPVDSFTDGQLGAFDVWGYAADSWASASEWQTSKFTVDDLKSSMNFNPASPYVGWDLTVSGTISRVYGTASTDNAWLIDESYGTFALGGGNSWDETYTITKAELSENVTVLLRINDSPLDGLVESSYIVNEDVRFQIELRWEENGDLVGGLSAHDYKIKFWWDWDDTDESQLQGITANPENFDVGCGGDEVFLARTYDNIPTELWRARVPIVQGGILTFLMPNENETANQYTFKIEDYTQVFYDGWARLYTGAGIVNEDWWDVSLNSYAYLKLHGYYKIRLFSSGMNKQYDFQHFQAESDTTPDPWIVRHLGVAEGIVYKYDLISVVGYRDENTGYIKADWSCQDENTTLVTIQVYDVNKEPVGDNSEYAYPSTVWFVWDEADNDSGYWVEVQTRHEIFGTWSEWFSLGEVIPWGPGLPDMGGTGSPIPLAVLGGIGIVAATAMCFKADFVGAAMIGIPTMVAFLKYAGMVMGINIMPVPTEVIIFMFVIGILWNIGEAT